MFLIPLLFEGGFFIVKQLFIVLSKENKMGKKRRIINKLKKFGAKHANHPIVKDHVETPVVEVVETPVVETPVVETPTAKKPATKKSTTKKKSTWTRKKTTQSGV